LFPNIEIIPNTRIRVGRTSEEERRAMRKFLPRNEL
jgi:hypothetical protein